MENKPKLLAPAGDFTSLKAAIDSGCDEVYFGVKGFNMRANAGNFSKEDIKKVASACHKNGVKAYLALNTIIYENEISYLDKIIKECKSAKIDGVIAWDMAVIDKCLRYNMPIHLSTQVSISNSESLIFYKKKIPDLKRVILARECSLEDIKKIIKLISKKKLDIEIETFVHGAMCVSVSGRCFMSQEIFGKSANRGECLQPCRRKYEVYELKDPEENHTIHLGDDYVMSPKDMCALPFIELLIDSGISAFKIEGRNRSPEYAKVTVSCYREIIDYYTSNKNKIKRNKEEKNKFEELKKDLMEKLKTVYNRDFSKGFFLGKPVDEWCKAYGSKATKTKEYLGKVVNYYPKISVAEVKLESGDINVGEELMFQGVTTGVFEQNATEIQTENGKFAQFAKKGTVIGLKVKNKVRKNDCMYRLKPAKF
jgi:putative protease